MKKLILAAVAVLVVISGCNSADAYQPSAAPIAASVPQVCLDALDDADGLVGISIDMLDIMVDVLDAVATFDINGIDRSDDINALTRQIERSTYAKNRDACRAA